MERRTAGPMNSTRSDAPRERERERERQRAEGQEGREGPCMLQTFIEEGSRHSCSRPGKGACVPFLMLQGRSRGNG